MKDENKANAPAAETAPAASKVSPKPAPEREPLFEADPWR